MICPRHDGGLAPRIAPVFKRAILLPSLRYVNLIGLVRLDPRRMIGSVSSQGLESRDLVAQVARAIRQNGLRLPTLVFLETTRPFAFLGGQLLWVLQPTLGFLVSRTTVGNLAHLLEDSQAIDSLIATLEVDETLEGREA